MPSPTSWRLVTPGARYETESVSQKPHRTAGHARLPRTRRTAGRPGRRGAPACLTATERKSSGRTSACRGHARHPRDAEHSGRPRRQGPLAAWLLTQQLGPTPGEPQRWDPRWPVSALPARGVAPRDTPPRATVAAPAAGNGRATRSQGRDRGRSLEVRPQKGIKTAPRRPGVTSPRNEGSRGQGGRWLGGGEAGSGDRDAKGLLPLGGDGLSASEQQHGGEDGTSSSAGCVKGSQRQGFAE